MNQSGINPSPGAETWRESLSASADGELSREELLFLLRRLDHDDNLRQAWHGYQLAGAAMRRQLPAMASAGFSARVMQAIENEASGSASSASRRHHWLRWSAGGAIAASVAVAALMVAQPTGEVDRMAAGTAGQAAGVVASAVPANAPEATATAAVNLPRQAAPAVVPPWLSGNAAGLLSQRASATTSSPFERAMSRGDRGNIQSMPHYRTLDNRDGSYLLLLDPANQPPPPERSRDYGLPH